MAEQLTGVLREVVALQSGRPRPALSTLFGLYIYGHLTSDRTAGCAADTALGSDAGSSQ